MNRGEIWWTVFDPAVGTEIQKTRPALVISNDSANRALNRVVVVPLTSNTSAVYPGQVLVEISGKSGKVLCDQIMAADKSRLVKKMSKLSRAEMLDVEHALKVHLGLPL